MNKKGVNDGRRMHFTIRCSEEEYAEMQSVWRKSTSQSFSEYARKVLMEAPVVVTCRNMSLDGLIDELNGLRNQLEQLMTCNPGPDEIESRRQILFEVKLIANKITEQCIPR